jgi:hypothetical protein
LSTTQGPIRLTMYEKGTRSVSTLTPSQLARKRANDREAQRAIRARTKEHIERLESELDALKSKHSRDQTIQELLRRNKTLQDELNRIQETVGITINTSSYSAPNVYDEHMSHSAGAIPSPRTSPFPSGSYAAHGPAALPEYGPGYVPFPNRCEPWTSQVPATSVPSNVSSPSSSVADELSASYMTTSAPTTMMHSPSGAVLPSHDDIKLEYDDGMQHNPHVPSTAPSSLPFLRFTRIPS